MLDTSPRVILVQNVGLFTVGDSLNAAKIAGDLTETNARVFHLLKKLQIINLFLKKIFLMLNIGL